MIFKTPNQAAKFLNGMQALPPEQQQHYADGIAEAMWKLIEADWSMYHVAGCMTGLILPAQLIVKIARRTTQK